MVMTSTTACIRTQDRSPGASHRGAAADARDWPSRDSCRHCPRHSVVGANDLLDVPRRWARRCDPTGGHRVVLGRGPVAAQRESHRPDASAMRQWIQNPRCWDNRGFFACPKEETCHPCPWDFGAVLCLAVGSPLSPTYHVTHIPRCCTCVGIPRNAARSAIGTVNDAGPGGRPILVMDAFQPRTRPRRGSGIHRVAFARISCVMWSSRSKSSM